MRITLLPDVPLALLPVPATQKTIQYLIPGWTTIVKLLKQVKNWQSPSQDPWSNCLINSREDDKGQSYYYSGRQKDNSKTICRHAEYGAVDLPAFQPLQTSPVEVSDVSSDRIVIHLLHVVQGEDVEDTR